MRRFGLVGRNISYSFSRGYFGDKFNALGLADHSYENFDLQSIAEFPALLQRIPGLAGLNVTIPYKEAIIPFLNSLDPEAAAIGAVNTICLGTDGTRGYNTDLAGFRDSLERILRPGDKQALILGTGGASKAVAYALGQLGLGYQFVSRDPGPGQLGYADLDARQLSGVQVLVNCTPLGTFPSVEHCPDLPYDALGPDHLLYDLIYNPAETTFLAHGRRRGARTKNGLEMLQIQAERAWSLWNH